VNEDEESGTGVSAAATKELREREVQWQMWLPDPPLLVRGAGGTTGDGPPSDSFVFLLRLFHQTQRLVDMISTNTTPLPSSSLSSSSAFLGLFRLFSEACAKFAKWSSSITSSSGSGSDRMDSEQSAGGTVNGEGRVGGGGKGRTSVGVRGKKAGKRTAKRRRREEDEWNGSDDSDSSYE